jgi:hypothetical protein
MRLIILGAAASLFAIPASACGMHGAFGAGFYGDGDGYGPRSWLTDEELEAQRKQAIADARAALVARFQALSGGDKAAAAVNSADPQTAVVSDLREPRP